MNPQFRHLVATALCFGLALSSNAGVPLASGLSVIAKNTGEEVEAAMVNLPNGSLLSAIAFKKAFVSVNPTEDCIVLPVEEGLFSGGVIVSGTALFTTGGAVYAYKSDKGVTLVSQLSPDDLRSGEVVRLRGAVADAFAQTHASERSFSGSAEQALQKAVALLSASNPTRPFVGGIVGASLVTLDAQRHPLMGGDEGLTWLVFDWNDWHCFYRPEIGVVKTTLPLHPVTGRPLVCDPESEFMEAVIFASEYPLLNRHERANVIFNAIPLDTGDVFTVYTKGPKVFAFSLREGIAELPELKPEDIYQQKTVRDAFNDSRKKTGYHGSVPNLTNHLDGDTAATLLARIYARLSALNVSATCVDSRLAFRCGPYAFEYRPGSHEARYVGFIPSPGARPRGILEAAVKASLLKRMEPERRILALPYIDKNRDVAATVVSAGADGVVVFVDGIKGAVPIGDVAFPVGQSGRYLELLQTITSRTKNAPTESDVKFGLNLPEYGFDGANDVMNAKSHLELAGIPFQLFDKTQERGPDGRLREYEAPCLSFQWNGVWYTFGPGQIATPSRGGILRD